MQIQIIYDNTIFQKDLCSDWGFAAFIEAHGRRILFDAGADGEILLENMAQMEIDPASIDTVFISHHHFDHTGGLATFLAQNNKVAVYVPASLRGVRNAARVIHVEEAVHLGEGLDSTGELMNIEQSLIVATPLGSVLVVGCSHPGVKAIMDAAAPYGNIHAIVGGLHGFREFVLLSDVRFICPTHCTRHVAALKKRFPEKYIEGGAGRKIEFESFDRETV